MNRGRRLTAEEEAAARELGQAFRRLTAVLRDLRRALRRR